MADKRIDELEAAASVTANDLFVLEQAGTAKKLEAFTLETWLLQLAQGHGGISTIAKTGSAGTDPVVDTYTITFADTTTTTFQVTNGVKGDQGVQTYVYIKYAAHEPTADADMTDTPSAWIGFCATTASTAPTTYASYSWYEYKGARVFIKYSDRDPIADSDLTDTPSAWMGVCTTTSDTAPTAYTAYSWYETKGAQGDPGNNITIESTSIQYQAWTSGTQYPTGTWEDNPPPVTPGNYMWTRTIVNYSDGGQTVAYSTARWGMDGSGAVGSVNNQLPDQDGNVTLTASDVGALADSYQPPVTSVNNKTGTVVLDNTDVNAPLSLSMSATLSSAGWYRVLQTNDRAGQSFDFAICRKGASADNEVHSVTLGVLYGGKYPWMNENSGSGTNQLIDKIRYTYDSSYAYADIHYTGSSANTVYVDIRPHGAADNNQSIAKNLTSVNDAPTGETVLTVYSFLSNTTESGSVSGSSGFTVNEVDVKQDGRTVYVHCYVTGSIPASTSTAVCSVSGVSLPTVRIRWLAGGGANAYDATTPVYATMSTAGTINVYSNTAISAVNITIAYIV